jgi:hypothetical protein
MWILILYLGFSFGSVEFNTALDCETALDQATSVFEDSVGLCVYKGEE